MKLHIDGPINIGARTGPSTFARRLLIQLTTSFGYELVDNGIDADVSLVFIERTGRQLAKRVVQRLDGIWSSPSEFLSKNVAIKETYDSADAIVFQSDYDKKLIEKHFGEKSCARVIRNGTFIKEQRATDNYMLLSLREEYDTIFVSSANWHSQKRLKSNVEFFMKWCEQNSELKGCLIVMGSNPDFVVSSRGNAKVMYTGSLEENVCNDVFSISDWMLHLAWGDHCPQTVVEALACKVPVVCSSVGGTKEIMPPWSTIIEDEPYDFELFDYSRPPPIALNSVTLARPDEASYDSNAVDITRAAGEYDAILREIASG